MTPKRKKVQDEWIKLTKQISSSSVSAKIWTNKFKRMSDKAFAKWMVDIKARNTHLAIWAPNGGDSKFDNRANLELAEKLGHSLFQYVDLPNAYGEITESNVKVMNFMGPVRRVSQLLDSKLYVPESDKKTDNLTGQPTKKSSGASISAPEIQILAGLGLNNSGKELMKVMGGDAGSYNAMTASISNKGTFSLQEIQPFATGVKSSKALKNLLVGVHLVTSKD